MSRSRNFTLSLLAACGCCALTGCEQPDQLPLSVALDYVHRHPEYFIPDPDDHTIVSEPPVGEDAEIDRHLAGDWVARKLAEYDELDAHSKIEWAQRSVEITRDALVSQREPGMDLLGNDCLCDAGFADAAFARLVRGVSNCDGVNHTLAMLLSVREPDTIMYTLDDSPDGEHRGGHTLTIMPTRRGPVFVDAWSDFGLMVLSEAVAWEVPAYDELAASDELEDDGLYARIQYQLGNPMPKTEVDYGSRDHDPDLTIPSDLPPITDARSAYLRARVLHLYGLEQEALELYRRAARMACVEWRAPLCQLSRVFMARLGEPVRLEPGGGRAIR